VQKGAAADVTIDDFSRLFAPKGLIDAFFNASLRPFVDTTQDPWKLRNARDVAVSADSLAEFQRAARIRDMFFGNGTTPALKFEITPVSIDSEASKAILSIDGQEIGFDGSSPHTISVQWPGPGGERQSTLSFAAKPPPAPAAAATPASTTQAAPAQTPAPTPAPPSPVITKTGPWSFFRLLDSVRLEKLGGTDRFRVTFSAGGHSATYDIHAGSVVNPLSSNDLAKFKCPPTL
jgi:type VI secretion system protein ImpL